MEISNKWCFINCNVFRSQMSSPSFIFRIFFVSHDLCCCFQHVLVVSVMFLVVYRTFLSFLNFDAVFYFLVVYIFFFWFPPFSVARKYFFCFQSFQSFFFILFRFNNVYTYCCCRFFFNFSVTSTLFIAHVYRSRRRFLAIFFFGPALKFCNSYHVVVVFSCLMSFSILLVFPFFFLKRN